MKAHPYANCFPMITGDAWDEFVADIKANGQKVPILLDDAGRIVDGRNRYAACVELGIECQVDRFTIAECQVLSTIESLNKHRRHLTTGQRAAAAAKMANLQQHSRAVQVSQDTCTTKPVSIAEAAAAAGVSRASAARMKRVINECEPEIVAAVEADELDVATAADAIANMEPDDQLEALDDIKTGKKTKKQVRKEAPREKRSTKTKTVKDYGYNPLPFGKQTKFQRALQAVVCLGKESESNFWKASKLKPAERQEFYNICFELPHVRWISQSGYIHVTTTTDVPDTDLESMIRKRIKEFSELVNSAEGSHDYAWGDAKIFCRDVLQLYAGMPTK